MQRLKVHLSANDSSLIPNLYFFFSQIINFTSKIIKFPVFIFIFFVLVLFTGSSKRNHTIQVLLNSLFSIGFNGFRKTKAKNNNSGQPPQTQMNWPAWLLVLFSRFRPIPLAASRDLCRLQMNAMNPSQFEANTSNWGFACELVTVEFGFASLLP